MRSPLVTSPDFSRPAAIRILRFLSSVLLTAWVGRSDTAAADTNTEQTRQTPSATPNVLPTESLATLSISPKS